jgi:glycosyltransferase involved in cell wall biosynthesis
LGQLDDDKAYRRMLSFEADVLRDADQVVYVSEWARRVVERVRQIVPRASAVIHNGVELPPRNAPAASREDLGASASDLLLINVGSLERRKNQIGLLDLFASVLDREPRAMLVLVGDGPERTAIESRTQVLGVASRVKLLGRRSDVASLLKAADLYVHYATAENCPMAVLEASRAGLPWAAVPAAGVEELQRLIGGCITINPNDLAHSTDEIVSLLADQPRRARLGAAARDGFLARFTRHAMVSSYVRLLGNSRHAESVLRGAA